MFSLYKPMPTLNLPFYCLCCLLALFLLVLLLDSTFPRIFSNILPPFPHPIPATLLCCVSYNRMNSLVKLILQEELLSIILDNSFPIANGLCYKVNDPLYFPYHCSRTKWDDGTDSWSNCQLDMQKQKHPQSSQTVKLRKEGEGRSKFGSLYRPLPSPFPHPPPSTLDGYLPILLSKYSLPVCIYPHSYCNIAVQTAKISHRLQPPNWTSYCQFCHPLEVISGSLSAFFMTLSAVFSTQ